MEIWSKDRIRELVREYPEYKDGRLTEEETQEIVDHLHANQAELFEDFLKPDIQRELIRMVNKGELEYDPETDTYRSTRPGK